MTPFGTSAHHITVSEPVVSVRVEVEGVVVADTTEARVLHEGALPPRYYIPVQDVRVGMAVWTTDREGRRIVGVVLKTGRMQAPLGHEVVRLTLADGRTVTASPGHPTADGRTLSEIEPGDRFDGSRVIAATPVGYSGLATYDLLPSGPTGTYFANGVLLGSTLAQGAGR